MTYDEVPARIWDKIAKRDDGCWIWTAATDLNGYGRVNWGGHARTVSAHRLMYRLLIGEPGGSDLDHLCRRRACVNPAHLEPVTHLENVRRGVGGQVASQRYAEHLWCPKKHPLFGDNLYAHIQKAGYVNKQCRTCRAENSRKSRERRRRRANPPTT